MHPTIAQALKPFTPPTRRDFVVTINGLESVITARDTVEALQLALASLPQMPDRLSVHARPMRKIENTVRGDGYPF